MTTYLSFFPPELGMVLSYYCRQHGLRKKMRFEVEKCGSPGQITSLVELVFSSIK